MFASYSGVLNGNGICVCRTFRTLRNSLKSSASWIENGEKGKWAAKRLASCSLAFTTACASRSEEHTSELQSLMRISYAVFCLKKKTHHTPHNTLTQHKLPEL